MALDLDQMFEKGARAVPWRHQHIADAWMEIALAFLEIIL